MIATGSGVVDVVVVVVNATGSSVVDVVVVIAMATGSGVVDVVVVVATGSGVVEVVGSNPDVAVVNLSSRRALAQTKKRSSCAQQPSGCHP